MTKLTPFAYDVRAITIGSLVVPSKVELDEEDDALVMTVSGGKGPAGLKPAPPTLLFDFCRLANQPASEVLRFAQSWGLLGQAIARRFVLPRRSRWSESREPLWLWRQVAKKTIALAAIAAELSEGRPGRTDDWVSAVDDTTHTAPSDLTMRERRQLLELLLEDWLGASQAAPRLNWTRIDPSLEWRGNGVMFALAVQLVLAIVSEKGVAVCSVPDCRLPYLPVRRPADDRHRFCPDHASRGPSLLAKRAKRAEAKRKERVSG